MHRFEEPLRSQRMGSGALSANKWRKTGGHEIGGGFLFGSFPLLSLGVKEYKHVYLILTLSPTKTKKKKKVLKGNANFP